MMNYYIDVMGDGKVRACLSLEQPDVGPPAPDWEHQAEGTIIMVDAPVIWSGPTDTSELYWKDGAYEWVETADMATLKARKNDEINAARLLANQSYFDFADKQIACDEVSMLDIQCINAEVCLTRKIPATFPGYWKARDNTYTSIPDVATWTLFIQAMVTRGAAHFAHAQKLKADLIVAATPAQVEAIAW
jgi:hypothetical protein